MSATDKLLYVQHVTVEFHIGGIVGGSLLVAVNDISFSLDKDRPEIFTLAGESGSGKTTLSRLILHDLDPTRGKILFEGRDLATIKKRSEFKEFMKKVQPVLQYPFETFIAPYARWTPIKKTLQESLRGEIDGARATLEMATVRREDGQFRRAIELAAGVSETANKILKETYRVAAHNAILEFGTEVIRVQQDGGLEFAPAELETTDAVFRPTVFLYDSYPGGIGLSAPLYAQADEVVRRARAAIEACTCRSGCSSCVGPILASDEARGCSPKLAALTVLGLLQQGAQQTSPGAPCPSQHIGPPSG